MNEDNVLHEENQTDVPETSPPIENSEADTVETVLEDSEVSSSETSPSALDELIEAIKKELASGEANSETVTETVPESEASDDVDEDAEESFPDEEYLVDDIHPDAYQTDTGNVVYLATDSNASGFQGTVVNRLDNILTCSIITACCAVLILLHTLKKE